MQKRGGISVSFNYKREDGKVLASFFEYGIRHERSVYYTSDWKVFYCDDSNLPVSIASLECYAAWLGDPWSQADEHYEMQVNCKDAYTEMKDEDPLWVCVYWVRGYEGTRTGIYGYGNTEEEALADCKKHYKYIMETYGEQEEE